MSKNDTQDFAELYENSLKKLEEGTVVEGTIVDIVGDDIFVDLGYKADGVIPRGEFSYGDEKPADKPKSREKTETQSVPAKTADKPEKEPYRSESPLFLLKVFSHI